MDGSYEPDLKALTEYIERLLDTKAARETEVREASIRPFREKIEAMIEEFDDQPVRGGGMLMPSKRRRVRGFLEFYVFAHEKLPSGPTRVSSNSDLFPWDLGMINFDET